MKTNDLKKLQSLVKKFENEVLFNEESNDTILGVFIDKKEQKNRIIILTNEDSDEIHTNKTAEAHFGNTDYKIVKQKGIPKSTSTLLTGGGIRSKRLRQWGTMGGFFTKKGSNQQYGVSNAHVLAGSKNSRSGDECIYHPNIKAGQLYKWFNLKLPPKKNYIDAAVFKIYPRHKGKWNPVKPHKLIGARLNLRVYKQGNTTGRTSGIVTSYNGAAKVKLNGKFYYFSGIISIKGINEPFNDFGDSGSIVFSQAGNHMVALVFAKSGGYCWALPIKHIQRLIK
ncbi:hypothetical protein H2O64_19965 [Kordia sp. YSTF-M3]|uniref:Uncharacterized protein n=1 Tax=Kordia aestuariivivens TaxID=2759037 RepID=A0ABR7QEN3_9FLAO|nr:hypothetical protein [Kordia aestuariivivens]MBC8756958.1 hypothetical protein [Kordia aestuariivivens]